MNDEPLDALLAHDVDEPLPPDQERRIREGLAGLLGAPVTPPAASAPAAPPAAKTPSAVPVAPAAIGKAAITALVLGAAAAGFAVGRTTAPEPKAPAVAPPTVPVVTTAPYPSVAPVVTGAPSGSALVVTPPPSASVRPATVSTAPRPSSTAGDQDAFDREQSLLERARIALVRHDAPAAAQALDEADRLFPKPRQPEERDYLRIQLLREQGDTARARERAQAFLVTYPTSLLRGRVERLLE